MEFPIRRLTIAGAAALALAACGEEPARAPAPGGAAKADFNPNARVAAEDLAAAGLREDLRTPGGDFRSPPADLWEPMQGCVAADRVTPTLDPALLPSVKSRPVRVQYSDRKDDQGRNVALYRDAIEETALLPGGIPLTVKLGGCESHTNSYFFRLPVAEAGNANSQYWLKRASSLMALVEPANLDPSVDIPALRRTLDRRSGDPPVDMRRGGFYGDVDLDRPQSVIVEGFGVRAVNAGDHTELEVQYTIGPL